MAKAGQANHPPKLIPLMIEGKVNEVLAIIISNQYNKSEREKGGKGLVHKAVEYGLKIDLQFKILTALLLHGLDPLDESDDGTSPWDIACHGRSNLARDILTPYINPQELSHLSVRVMSDVKKLSTILENADES